MSEPSCRHAQPPGNPKAYLSSPPENHQPVSCTQTQKSSGIWLSSNACPFSHRLLLSAGPFFSRFSDSIWGAVENQLFLEGHPQHAEDKVSARRTKQKISKEIPQPDGKKANERAGSEQHLQEECQAEEKKNCVYHRSSNRCKPSVLQHLRSHLLLPCSTRFYKHVPGHSAGLSAAVRPCRLRRLPFCSPSLHGFAGMGG